MSPRVFIAPEGLQLTIAISNNKIRPQPLPRRVYRDSLTEVCVTAQDADPRIEEIGYTFSYNGKPYFDAQNIRRGTTFTNATTERRGSAKALAALGIEKVEMWSKNPPAPDLLIKAPEIGQVFVKHTLGEDSEEREFQAAMQRLCAIIDEQLRSAVPPWPEERGVALGFVTIPPRREYPDFAKRIVDFLQSTNRKPATYHPPEAIKRFSPSIQITTGGRPGVTGGSLVQQRGHADYWQAAVKRIEEKRSKKYLTSGLPIWLVVSLALPMFGNFLNKLYNTDIELGIFQRLILMNDAELVSFERR